MWNIDHVTIAHSWLVKLTGTTTSRGLFYISSREALFWVAHFLTAGRHVDSAKQLCSQSCKRFKVLLRDTSTTLGLQWSMNLWSPAWGYFSVHCHPATAALVQKVLEMLLVPKQRAGSHVIVISYNKEFCACKANQCSGGFPGGLISRYSFASLLWFRLKELKAHEMLIG